MLSRIIALAAFFLSGFSALLYQVIWQRLLVFFSGADVHSVTIIVAAFMTGLGIGNLAGGHVADRLSPRQNLWAFVIAEVAIGAFALASKSLYYDFLYQELAFLSGSRWADPILFVSLLWPTFFMGVSLPLLARALTHDIAQAGRVVGALYGFNTLGAATGAFATTWILVPAVGLASALPIGAALNFSCAIAAASLALAHSGRIGIGTRGTESTVVALPAVDREHEFSFRVWTIVYCATGFTSLSMEIVWFRVLGVIHKSTAFTFGTVLAIYLFGLGVGAAAGALLVPRSTRPGRTFLALQTLLMLVSAVSVIAFLEVVSGGSPAMLVEHLSGNDYSVAQAIDSLAAWSAGSSEPAHAATATEFLGLFIVLPLALIGLPTLLMGLSFPFLQKAVQANPALVGRRVGTMMTANIAGSATGTVLTGLVLLPLAGTATTLKIIVGLAALPAALWVWSTTRTTRLILGISLTMSIAWSVVALPDGDRLWATLHGVEPRRVIATEDGAGVTVLKAGPGGFERRALVFVNGLSQSWIPFGNVHTVLGALPLLIHPDPSQIAIIGLGSGDTAFSAGAHRETERIICIEIISGQRVALDRLSSLFPDPGLVSLLSDRRIDHVVDDGRAYLLQSSRRFDIIEADALRPATAYSGNLYSEEYFDLLRRRLNTGGLAVTWAPTERVGRTFRKVFPYVVAMRDIYIGSSEPISLDRQTLNARLHDPAFVRYYAAAGIDVRVLLQAYLDSDFQLYTSGPERTADADLNSDLFPRDEFRMSDLD